MQAYQAIDAAAPVASRLVPRPTAEQVSRGPATTFPMCVQTKRTSPAGRPRSPAVQPTRNLLLPGDSDPESENLDRSQSLETSPEAARLLSRQRSAKRATPGQQGCTTRPTKLATTRDGTWAFRVPPRDDPTPARSAGADRSCRLSDSPITAAEAEVDLARSPLVRDCAPEATDP